MGNKIITFKILLITQGFLLHDMVLELQQNSVALVCKQTTPNEWLPVVGEVIANFSG
jgi:hypothetical protein